MSSNTLPAAHRSTVSPGDPPFDTATFVNAGEFFDTHPGVVPWVTRYEQTALDGSLIESWERDKNGRMVNVTKRDLYRKELIEAQEQLAKLQEEQ